MNTKESFSNSIWQSSKNADGGARVPPAFISAVKELHGPKQSQLSTSGLAQRIGING